MSEEPQQPSDPAQLIVTCSSCGGAIQIAAEEVSTTVTCPHCNATFIAAIPEQQIIDDTEPDIEEEIVSSDDELDENRIRQVAALRRSLYRSRSYCIVGIITCVVTSIQLVLYGFDAYRAQLVGKVAGFGICAAAALILAGVLLRKAHSIHVEISALLHHDEPTTAPDFSKLSDGSQRWKNLEDMTGGK